MKRHQLLQLVAKTAATQLASLPTERRANVLDGLALILAGKREKELARYTAGLIRLADEHQVKFFQELNDVVVLPRDEKAGRKGNRQSKSGVVELRE